MNLEPLFQEISILQKRVEHMYIYGFGSYGRNLFAILKRNGISVDGFVISGKAEDKKHEIPVYSITQLLNKKAGYILALNARNFQEVQTYLTENNIGCEYIINAGKYIEQFGEKRGVRTGSIEVTTVIGCGINCMYCPQDILLAKYFEKDKNRASKMTLQTFMKCLEYFPKDYDISFGGMSEPFLNENFMEMLEMASESGRRISLYTTLAYTGGGYRRTLNITS